jgi:aspartate/methionine/tyrosine aminotransferase
MLHDAGIVLVPGMDFGSYQPREYIRLSYATAYSKLEEAVERLRKLFGGGDGAVASPKTSLKA